MISYIVMKIHSLFAEILIFLAVLLFLVVPPLFSAVGSGGVVFIEWNFPLNQLISSIIAACILIFYKKLRKEKINILGFRVFLTIGLLFLSFFIINFVSILINPANKTENIVNVSRPESFIQWIFCILNFILASFYEEVIYRFYFTDTLKSILVQTSDIFDNKIVAIICEIAGCAVFAFAHIYLGWLPVINAAIAHFVLRYAYKKSNSIIPGWIAHFAYNMISLILL